MKQRPHTINVGGKLLSLSPAVVMGIINITPDSFYAKSKVNDEESLRQRVLQIINDGGKIIDVGAYSSRPGAKNVSQEEEMTRLRHSLKIIQEAKLLKLSKVWAGKFRQAFPRIRHLFWRA